MFRKVLFYMLVFAGFVGLATLVSPAEANQLLTAQSFDGLGMPVAIGLIVNKANLEAVFLNIKTTFNKAFEGAPSEWEKTCMLIPSTSSQNNYNWLSRFPKMREWLGDKVVKALAAFKYTIVNKSYESTIAVDRDDIDDDNLGIYGPMAQEAGLSAKTHPDELLADLKNSIFTTLCFDEQYFYDTDHPVGNGVEVPVASVSNKLVAALSCANKAAAIASLGAAETAMMNFTDDEGRRLGLKPSILEVPASLKEVGKTLCYEDKLDDNSPNPYKGNFELHVNTRLTSNTAWFLHCTTRAVKPFVYQERKKPVFVQQTDMNSDDVFNRKEYKFGVEARGNVGVALWQLSVGSTGLGA